MTAVAPRPQDIALTEAREANAYLRQVNAALFRIVAEHIADGLLSNDLPVEAAVKRLATELDEAGVGIDGRVDDVLLDRGLTASRVWAGVAEPGPEARR